MKIYNLGNDYAFQQKQKLEQETSKVNPSSDNKLKQKSGKERGPSDLMKRLWGIFFMSMPLSSIIC